MTTVKVDQAKKLGEVPRLIYGHFTEHLAHIIYGGFWAEMIYDRKFESPMFSRVTPEMAAMWKPFGGKTDNATYLRAPMPIPRYASPHAAAHHCQSIVLQDGHDGTEHGIAQPEIVIDKGVDYEFRGRVRRFGPATSAKVALRASDGETILAEAELDVDEYPGDHPVLRWMDAANWVEISCSLRPEKSEPSGWFTITTSAPAGESATLLIDTVSLMPSDHIEGLDPRIVEELKELPEPMLKWPGGCMADNYDWRLGIGPRDARYPFMEQAWLSWDENDFGTDEFLRLCDLIGCEPFICVNSGSGTPEEAAAWVEYVNGSADTEWGKVRSSNGVHEPYGVRYWCVGNEQWGSFERGYDGAEGYARRFKQFSEAMRKVDPSIILVAAGQPGDFDKTLFREAAPQIDLVSIHHYSPEIEATEDDAARRKILTGRTYDAIFEQVKQDIASVPDASNIRVAFDEWGFARSNHAGAVYTAVALNAIHRAAPLVSVANRSCAVNIDGVVAREGTRVWREPVYETFRLYNLAHRSHAIDATTDDEELDVSALTDDGGRMSIFLVNAAPEEKPIEIQAGVAAGSTTKVDTLTAGPSGEWGPSSSASGEEPWSENRKLPPYSLTVLRIN